MFKHNKKRNVGLVYEFLARYLAKAIVENSDKNILLAKDIVKKHFNKGTDLYKELKLFKTLYETKLGSQDMARDLVSRVKQACKLQSQSRLDLEKTSLIHEINTKISDKFFDQPILEFRDYATVQVLLNHWRESGILSEDIGAVFDLETKLLEFMTTPVNKVNATDNISKMTDSDVNGLVINIMAEKINKKFANTLDENQKKLIQLYVFSNGVDVNNTHEELIKTLTGVRDKYLGTFSGLVTEGTFTKSLEDKLSTVKQLLSETYHDVSKPNDELIMFYMGLSTLEKELRNA